MRDVCVRAAVVRAGTELVLNNLRVVSSDHYDSLIGSLIFSFRVGVSGNELKAAGESLRDLKRQTVVKRSSGAFENADAVEGWLSSRTRNRTRRTGRAGKTQKGETLSRRNRGIRINYRRNRRKQVDVARAT